MDSFAVYLLLVAIIGPLMIVLLFQFGVWLWLRRLWVWIRHVWMYPTTIVGGFLAPPVIGFTLGDKAIGWYCLILQIVGSLILGVRVLGKLKESDGIELKERLIRKLRLFREQTVTLGALVADAIPGQFSVTLTGLTGEDRLAELERRVGVVQSGLDKGQTELRTTRDELTRLVKDLEKELKESAVRGIDWEIFGLALTLIGTAYGTGWPLWFGPCTPPKLW